MTKQEKEVLKIFLELVKIDSESGNEKKVADFIIDFLKEINIKAKRDSYGNVIAKIRGRGESLILIAHMDIVAPGKGIKPKVVKGVVKSDGRTVLGADDKAGIASILFAIKNFNNSRSVELVFTVEEEIGCKGAENLDYRMTESKQAVVIDSTAPVGYITVTSPFIFSFSGEILGKGGHARTPEEGVNAINIFAEFLNKFKPGRINENAVSNIGAVVGGNSSNVICDNVKFKGEIRAFDKKVLERERKRLKFILSKATRKNQARFKLKTERLVRGYNYKKSDNLIRFVAGGIKKAGFEVNYQKRMGGTDANVFCEKGIRALSIGHGRRNVHSIRESIAVSDLLGTAKVIGKLCRGVDLV